MEAKKLFAVVGTDARQAAAGRVLERAGYAVGGAEQVALADYILLPLPLDAARTRTLWGTNLLLLGFGPVGQALGVRLAALGANVTVCARRAEQRALAESLGLRGAELARLAVLAPAFDTVVNTVPPDTAGEAVARTVLTILREREEHT